jgi:hypothetical protein
VILTRDGIKHHAKVHRLVLEAFVGPCPEGKECAHDNGVRTDNRLSNLAWKTKLENGADRKRHGTANRKPVQKLAEAQVSSIKTRLRAGESHAALGQEFNVSASTIWNIANGKTWSQVEPDAA